MGVKGKNHDRNLPHFVMLSEAAQTDIQSFLEPIVEGEESTHSNLDTPKQRMAPFSPFHRS